MYLLLKLLEFCQTELVAEGRFRKKQIWQLSVRGVVHRATHVQHVSQGFESLWGIQTAGIGRLTSGQQGFWKKVNKSMFSSPGDNSVLTAELQNRRKKNLELSRHKGISFSEFRYLTPFQESPGMEWKIKQFQLQRSRIAQYRNGLYALCDPLVEVQEKQE